jgi:hypothetical protein
MCLLLVEGRALSGAQAEEFKTIVKWVDFILTIIGRQDPNNTWED